MDHLLQPESMISIHALREEGDVADAVKEFNIRAFLSTPSARRATPTSEPPAQPAHYFYPRPPRGGRPETLPPWRR